MAAFQAELYSDNGGVPGPLLTDNTVTVGDTFFLQITAQEFDRFRSGLGSAAVDVDWDAGLLSAVESDFQLDSVITADLPLLRGGSLDNQTGTIDDLSGTALLSSGAGRAIGNNRAETFATIRMQAGTEPGVATIELSKSHGKKTITVPSKVLGEQHLRFDVESIVIAPADESEVELLVEPEDAASKTEPASNSKQASDVEVLDSVPEPVSDDESAAADEPTQEQPPEEEPAESTPPAIADDDHTDTGAADAVGAALAEPSTSSGPSAADIDTALSFDLNQDGIFDLADFGLLNIRAAQPSSDTTETATGDSSLGTQDADPPINQPGVLILHHVCIVAPPRENAAAFEAWLDALAYAWIADIDARRQRRDELF